MTQAGLVPTGWRMRGGVLAAVGVALAGVSLSSADVVRPVLGTAGTFAVLGGSTVTNTGPSAVTGDVGVSPGSAIDGFPPGIVTGGVLHRDNATAKQAHKHASLAYAFLAGMASDTVLTGTDLGGLTLLPGVYKFNAAAGLTGALTLDAGGDSRALFVFQIGSALTVAGGGSVVVTNGGADYDESNVYWQIGSSAVLHTGVAFTGNILAYSSITLETGASLIGNALALNGAVTLDSNAVTFAPRTEDDVRPAKGRTTLAPTGGDPDAKATARLDVKHFPAKGSRLERSWIKMKVRHLDGSTDCTLWADDPATPATDLVQFDTFTTSRNGSFNFSSDTKHGDTLPFGATLAALAGKGIEVRDAAGTTTILAGTIPTTAP